MKPTAEDRMTKAVGCLVMVAVLFAICGTTGVVALYMRGHW